MTRPTPDTRLAKVLDWISRLDEALGNAIDRREEDVLRSDVQRLRCEVDALKRHKPAKSL